MAYGGAKTARHIALAEQRVLFGRAAARRWLNVAPHRVFLAGYGSGATMALRIGSTRLARCRRAVRLAGHFPAR